MLFYILYFNCIVLIENREEIIATLQAPALNIRQRNHREKLFT